MVSFLLPEDRSRESEEADGNLSIGCWPIVYQATENLSCELQPAQHERKALTSSMTDLFVLGLSKDERMISPKLLLEPRH